MYGYSPKLVTLTTQMLLFFFVESMKCDLVWIHCMSNIYHFKYKLKKKKKHVHKKMKLNKKCFTIRY